MKDEEARAAALRLKNVMEEQQAQLTSLTREVNALRTQLRDSEQTIEAVVADAARQASATEAELVRLVSRLVGALTPSEIWPEVRTR